MRVPRFLKYSGWAMLVQMVFLSLCQKYPNQQFLRFVWETFYTPIQTVLFNELNLDTDILSGIIMLLIPLSIYALLFAGLFWLIVRRGSITTAQDI
jgi:hypothetical protein